MKVTAFEMTNTDLRTLDIWIYEDYFQESDLGWIDEGGKCTAPYFSTDLNACQYLLSELKQNTVVKTPLRPAIKMQSTSLGYTVSILGGYVTAKAETLPAAIALAFWHWHKKEFDIPQ